jgi:hypothetical protein
MKLIKIIINVINGKENLVLGSPYMKKGNKFFTVGH